MSNGSSSWRVEAYGGPALSFWFVVFALALVLAASAWWVPGIDASQPAAIGEPAAAAQPPAACQCDGDTAR